MTKKLSKKIELVDQIVLDVWDTSRVAAGDRWFVRIEVSGDVSVKKQHFDTTRDTDTSYSEALRLIGPTVRYEYKRERIFVDKKIKDEVFKELVATFEKDTLPYVSRPDFFKKFVLSRYAASCRPIVPQAQSVYT